jgi:RNA polymerase sigma-70 factor (ECF subfamily)
VSSATSDGVDDRDGGELERVFTAERPRLVGLAYRVTGSRVDAEDVVQEAWLRAQRVDGSTIDRPAAWFTTVVSRLALDQLRSARRRRETYVGPWLPEPVRTAPWPGAAPVAGRPGETPGSRSDDPAELAEAAESLTFGFLRVLETLGPAERVVFLLADVFDTPYDQIAAVVDRSPEACRQLASRARRRVQDGRVRYDLPDDARRVVASLLVAISAGEVDDVVHLLADDAVLVSDGGVSARAARRPVVGAVRVARFLVNLGRRMTSAMSVELASINDEPGVVVRQEDGRLYYTMSVQVSGGRAIAVHAVRNPDKLAALDIDTAMV